MMSKKLYFSNTNYTMDNATIFLILQNISYNDFRYSTTKNTRTSLGERKKYDLYPNKH